MDESPLTPILRRYTVQLRYEGGDLIDYATSDDMGEAFWYAQHAAFTSGVSDVQIRDTNSPGLILTVEAVDSERTPTHGNP